MGVLKEGETGKMLKRKDKYTETSPKTWKELKVLSCLCVSARAR